MFKKLLLLLALLPACTSATRPPDGALEEQINSLSAAEAGKELEEISAQIEDIDEELRSAEARRMNAERVAGTDSTKEDAVGAAEATLANLQERKGVLIQRQVLLERRIRALNSDL